MLRYIAVTIMVQDCNTWSVIRENLCGELYDGKLSRTVRERLSYIMITLGRFVSSLLSLGAIFSLFAGYYYWSPLITGLHYNNNLANIQFWLLFIGANVIFFPMHFLGIG